ncbi:MAG: hypothetical protein JRI23_33620 [Deltaproteobacteria bacterium]|jgi:type IV fimbrial biogenesis protein FimT|nr:hypothetical protein [Deltaproteobacteria bacterium]MBW2537221.1 hypothetical protein [Deltaproteobacteria bacterium]
MAELLAALAIIGILAAAASPVFVQTMRDNRVGSAANQIAEMYRHARSRALGRGTCVMVRFDHDHALPSNTDPAGKFTMREAVAGGTNAACAPRPSSNCVGTDWSSSSTDSRFVAAFDHAAPQFSPAAVAVYSLDYDTTAGSFSENAQDDLDIVFSPRGRAFIRHPTSGGYQTLLGAFRIEVNNPNTTFVRQVVIPPNGSARVVGRM